MQYKRTENEKGSPVVSIEITKCVKSFFSGHQRKYIISQIYQTARARTHTQHNRGKWNMEL